MEERIRERYRKYQEEQEIRLKVTFKGFDSDYSFNGDSYERNDICETFRIEYSIDDERRDFGHNTIDGDCRYINLMIAGTTSRKSTSQTEISLLIQLLFT